MRSEEDREVIAVRNLLYRCLRDVRASIVHPEKPHEKRRSE